VSGEDDDADHRCKTFLLVELTRTCARSQTNRSSSHCAAESARGQGSYTVSKPLRRGTSHAKLLQSQFLQSPYLFMMCHLEPDDSSISEQEAKEALTGSISSSLHRLKDVDNQGECRSDAVLTLR